jgi:putative restriction endonuclease
MAVTLSEIESTLAGFGLSREHETEKKTLFVHPTTGDAVYINRDRHIPVLVIHPRHDSLRKALASIPGVIAEGYWYHSSNMRRFPTRMHQGKKETPYGIQFSFEYLQSLKSFLDRLFSSSPQRDHFDDVEQANTELKNLPATERDALVKSRVRQGPFRKSLEQYWQGCAVTNCQLGEALRESHIKPWRNSNNSERLDVYNGLLLTVNHDDLFDRGQVSFANDGTILISSKVSKRHLELLAVSSSFRLRRVESKHREYLSYHRSQLFIE